jgi:hypothetical protein
MPVIANTGAMLLIGHKGTNFAFGLSLPNLVRNQHRKCATSHPFSGARDGLPSGSRAALQKLFPCHLGFEDLQAKLGSLFLEQIDLLVAVSVLIKLHSFIDVLLTVLQHSVH